LSPLQFGIPNDRLRYYLAAQRSNAARARAQSAEEYLTTASIHTTWPFFPADESSIAPRTSKPSVNQTFKVSTLDYFLQNPQSNFEEFLVPHEYLTKNLHGFRFGGYSHLQQSISIKCTNLVHLQRHCTSKR